MQINELKHWREAGRRGVECRILKHSCACPGGRMKGSQLFNQLFINGLYKPRGGSKGHVSRYATPVSLCDTKGNGREWARAVESRRGGPASAARRQAEKPEGNSGNRGRGAGVEPDRTAGHGTRQPAARARTMATSGQGQAAHSLSVVLFTLGRRMTMSIHSLVPDAKALLELEPEELAGVLMEVASGCRCGRGFETTSRGGSGARHPTGRRGRQCHECAEDQALIRPPGRCASLQGQWVQADLARRWGAL